VEAFVKRRQFNLEMFGALGAMALGRHGRAPALSPVDIRQVTADAGVDGIAPLRIDRVRLLSHLEKLAEIGKGPGGTSRVAYSDADKAGREYVTQLMREARLEPSIDAAANIIGKRDGRDASRKPILFGSHIDTVPDGGNYDGVVGSLSAIEVARTLAENDITTRHPLQVVIWQNEEGGLVGSRAANGELTERDLALPARSGRTIGDGINFLGGDVAHLESARRVPGSIACYMELHIEQGAVLDKENVDIGIVEGIVGIGWWDVTVDGFANHAGTTPMDQRRDALLAASRFVGAVERVVRSEPGRQVGTVGRIQAFPGAPNVIPGRVVLSLELRDLDKAKIARLFTRIQEAGLEIGRETGTTFSYAPTFSSDPALADQRIKRAIADAASELRLTTKPMPSGAGHDAQVMARVGPSGMIFVPSVGGISHSPRELTSPDDIENGANVLLNVIQRLDRTLA
jgi:N-carbamoyl-L-amino-acid hydrolase